MANRNRQSQYDRNDRYDREYRGGGRQEEQFRDSNYSQYGDDNYGSGSYGSQMNDRDHDYGRSRYGRSDYGRSSDRGYGDNMSGGYQRSQNRYGNERDYNPFDDYDSDNQRYGSSRGSRFDNRSHSYFRGDDYGGPNMGSSRSDYGYYGGAGMGSYGRDYDNDRYSNRSRNDDRGFFEKAGDEVASWFGDEDAERRRRRDHRGRGPSNYTRSDERILEDACDRLTDERSLDARNIEVTVANQEVTLDGTVESRWDKRRAEDCVHDLSGVNHVQNNLRIEENDSDDQSWNDSNTRNNTRTTDTTNTSSDLS